MLIDACVLYPTVMREIVLGVAATGLFAPHWSARILEEWARAAAQLGAGQETLARGEIALLRSRWPGAEVAEDPALEASLYLPDAADCHVLAAAINSRCEALMTLNLRDFPPRILNEFQIGARHPDAILRTLLDQHPAEITAVAERVRAEAERLSGAPQPLRKLLKKARLPRLGKALG